MDEQTRFPTDASGQCMSSEDLIALARLLNGLFQDVQGEADATTIDSINRVSILVQTLL